MSSLLDIEEDATSEITLSTASLLGIFFGLVLICAVFFGFGYSMGRGSERSGLASGSGSMSASNDQPSETTTAENPKSSALTSVEQPDALQTPAKTAPLPDTVRVKPNTEAPDPSTPDAPVVPARAAAPGLKRQSAAVPLATSAPDTNAAPSQGPMVQIAAVARQEDADVLVSALRQRGYGVVVRSDPQDKLLHVQVGPFADRTAATAIKQKLLSDGYNAIIKQ